MSSVFRSICIENEGGAIEGYSVASTAENLFNFLNKETSEEVARIATQIIQDQAKTIAVIKNLNVDDDQRGNGFGSSLMSEFMESANGAEAFILLADKYETQNDGFVLQKFYEGFDFAEAIPDTAAGPGDSTGPVMIWPIELAESVRDAVSQHLNKKKVKLEK